MFYRCRDGFLLSTHEYIKTCLEDDTWSSDDVTCVRVDCGPPPSMGNASVTYNSTTYQSEAHYECRHGHKAVSNDPMKYCSSNTMDLIDAIRPYLFYPSTSLFLKITAAAAAVDTISSNTMTTTKLVKQLQQQQ